MNISDSIHAINNDLKRLLSTRTEKLPGGLFSGGWGILLFLFYYEKYMDDSVDGAEGLLYQLYESMGDELDGNYTFCSGMSGPFWLLHHLRKYGFIDLDLEHIASDFIPAAISQSNHFIGRSEFDFLHGSSGICNVLVEFAHRQDVRAHLGMFVRKIQDAAVKTDKGYSLPFLYNHAEPTVYDGVDAFSLAHGTCALQLILMKIHRAGIEKDLCEVLIFKTMDFVLEHESKDALMPVSLFPACLDGKSVSSRVSWCYGDLNVAIALWYCGKYFEQQTWKDKAVEILTYNAGRITRDASGVVDVCLCHGSAGNAAMYLRMWHETKDPAFMACSKTWFDKTLKMLRLPDAQDLHGARVYKGKADGWQYHWNVLEGSAGVGLALMAHLTGAPLPWDEMMLLS